MNPLRSRLLKQKSEGLYISSFPLPPPVPLVFQALSYAKHLSSVSGCCIMWLWAALNWGTCPTCGVLHTAASVLSLEQKLRCCFHTPGSCQMLKQKIKGFGLFFFFVLKTFSRFLSLMPLALKEVITFQVNSSSVWSQYTTLTHITGICMHT